VGSVTIVAIGSNHFIDCPTLIAVRQHALLRVAATPLRVSLTTPPDLPSGKMVHQCDSDSNVQVVASDKSVAVFWGEAPLAIATLLDEATVSLRIDLRPIGISLFDDALGLHVGDNVFAGNQVANAPTAIALG
jgi:hypothetical protein